MGWVGVGGTKCRTLEFPGAVPLERMTDAPMDKNMWFQG